MTRIFTQDININMKLDSLLENLGKYTLYIVLTLFPVFVLGNFATPYVVPKEVLLIGGVSLITVLLVIRMIVNGSFSFSIGKFDLGVFLIAVAYVIATTLATPNKMEAYFFPGTTTFLLGSVFLYFLINQFGTKIKKNSGIAMFCGILLFSVSSILTTLNAYSKIPQLPSFVKDIAFNPMGGSVPSAILLATFIIYGIGLLLSEKDNLKKIFFGIAAAVLVSSLVLTIGSMIPGKADSPKFVSPQTSWEILVESLKKSPFLGVGPSNYLTAFNLFRSVSYNQTDLWQIRFTTASNYYFTLITETGFIGLFALILLLIAIYKTEVAELKGVGNPGKLLENASLIILLVLFAILPVTPALVVYLFAMLALFSKSESRTTKLSISSSESGTIASRIPAIIVGVPFFVGIGAVAFFGTKVLAAEITFKQALDALSNNDAKTTYTLMQSAINQNPQVDRYHASFAQVDMALASSVASKKDITDADRSTITQLVQQAIQEGKNAVVLNAGRSGNWEVLAQIYKSIMPFAQGADQFAIQTYTQAIALDPTNPNLRIALGGVYYALGNYDEAISAFKLAVAAKPDLANAHYNLAIAYREKKDYANAATEMQSVLTLVSKDSSDYKLAQSTLDEIRKNIPATSGQNGTSLQAPQKSEVSNVTPPITLPSESTPPATNK